MNVYAFDVDNTLDISDGPIMFSTLVRLREKGHAVGICGNWAVYLQKVKGWFAVTSFINLGMEKQAFLSTLKSSATYFDKYIMVGNEEDKWQAIGVGWEFVYAQDFREDE